MIRLILILAIIALVSLGLSWVADEPGSVVIHWSNYHIETSLLLLIASVAVLTLICAIIYSLIFILIRSPRNWARSRLAKHQMLGLEALTETFTALATQDIKYAKKYLSRAQNYLPHQPLTLMLSAQVARLDGNESNARLYIEQMLKNEGTEFMALRSLIESAHRSNDYKTAISHAEKAIALKPKNAWLITTLAELYAKSSRVQDALRLLELSARRGYIKSDVFKYEYAQILFENAKALAEKNQPDSAISTLIAALKKQPDFTEVTLLLAKLLTANDETKQAIKILRAAWERTPSEELSKALMGCVDTAEKQKKFASLLRKIGKIYPENSESQLLMAELDIKLGEFNSARARLKHVIAVNETAYACKVMAELEDAVGDHEQAAYWLKRSTNY